MLSDQRYMTARHMKGSFRIKKQQGQAGKADGERERGK
jgi:hypothetical protein